MVAKFCILPPPGGDTVKASENLGATEVAPVAPTNTSLHRGPDSMVSVVSLTQTNYVFERAKAEICGQF